MMFIDERGNYLNPENEKDEQVLVSAHLPKNAHVLELGARYGMVSCLISTLLDDPTKHVAVEPDMTVMRALVVNKLHNKGKFNIVNGTVSKKPVSLIPMNGYGNYTFVNETIDIYSVETYTLAEIEKRYDVTFDCLVADCEGFLEQFFRENEELLPRLNTVIFEADGEDRCDYNYVKQVMRENGLKPVVEGFQNVWSR